MIAASTNKHRTSKKTIENFVYIEPCYEKTDAKCLQKYLKNYNKLPQKQSPLRCDGSVDSSHKFDVLFYPYR